MTYNDEVRTVQVELVKFHPYSVPCRAAVEEMLLYELRQIGLIQRQQRAKRSEAHLANIMVELVLHPFLDHVKRSWFTGLGELL